MQKITIGQFPPKFSGPLVQKNYGSDPKKLGDAKMGWTSSMHMESMLEISGRTVTGDEKQRCYLFVCFLSRWMSRKEVCMFNNAV